MTPRDCRDTLALAETLFGRETGSFREAVRGAAERLGAERGLPPAELAEAAWEELTRPAPQVVEDARNGDLFVRETPGAPLRRIDEPELDSRAVNEALERYQRVTKGASS